MSIHTLIAVAEIITARSHLRNSVLVFLLAIPPNWAAGTAPISRAKAMRKGTWPVAIFPINPAVEEKSQRHLFFYKYLCAIFFTVINNITDMGGYQTFLLQFRYKPVTPVPGDKNKKTA